MTPLGRYLEQSGTTQRAFADKIGVSKSYVSEIVNGNKSPGLRLALRIATATGGVVPVTSLVRGETP